ncbi:hypothetical protein QTP70_021543, partial [Hemibagrus guttatus]
EVNTIVKAGQQIPSTQGPVHHAPHESSGNCWDRLRIGAQVSGSTCSKRAALSSSPAPCLPAGCRPALGFQGAAQTPHAEGHPQETFRLIYLAVEELKGPAVLDKSGVNLLKTP